MITLDAIEIQKIIPHRYPMLLVDRILELEPLMNNSYSAV
jgi:3-hydroxymyristoyl/3-hydroxydecanoyl-(acyl carrier protein) dehydratase